MSAGVILIVEDNERNLKLMRDVLQHPRLPHDRGDHGERRLRLAQTSCRTSCSWTSSSRT